MATIAVGNKIPRGEFEHIPYTPEQEDPKVCPGTRVVLSTDEFAGKKVVLVSVPGAFTPTCHKEHLPQFLAKYDDFKAKGVDIVAVVAANDAFVMNGWARVEQLKDKILALSDTNAQFSSSIGLSVDLSQARLGLRTARYALVLDDLVVKYIGAEPDKGITVSGADAVLAAL